jgi:heme/copper-type cytochrome/quinol oxidase subunit 2
MSKKQWLYFGLGLAFALVLVGLSIALLVILKRIPLTDNNTYIIEQDKKVKLLTTIITSLIISVAALFLYIIVMITDWKKVSTVSVPNQLSDKATMYLVLANFIGFLLLFSLILSIIIIYFTKQTTAESTEGVVYQSFTIEDYEQLRDVSYLFFGSCGIGVLIELCVVGILFYYRSKENKQKNEQQSVLSI